MQQIIIHGESQRLSAIELIKKLNLAKPWEISVKKYAKKITPPQMRWYFACIGVVVKETGNEKGDVHKCFKRMFLPVHTVDVMGVKIEKLTSLKDLDTIQQSEYMLKVFAFCGSELGILLPHPDDRNHAHE